MSTEDDTLRLRHMRDYAREIGQVTKGKTRHSLDNNLLLERALCYDIGIIGEAASKMLPETRNAYSGIPWQKIVGMRNYLFHAYFKVDKDVLWETATVSIPTLHSQLEAILPPDEPEDKGAEDGQDIEDKPE